MKKKLLTLAGLAVMVTVFSSVLSCDQGVPVPIDIERDFAFDVAAGVALLEEALRTQDCGGQPCLEENQPLPETWPADPFPDIQQEMDITTPKQDIDLTTPEYKDLNQASKAVDRVDINLIEFKVEVNSLNIDIPEALLQFADFGADPESEGIWKDVAKTPAIGAGEMGTKKVEFMSVNGKDGRDIISDLLKVKKFAFRLKSKATYDTQKNPNKPSGEGKGKVHLRVTFFLSPV